MPRRAGLSAARQAGDAFDYRCIVQEGEGPHETLTARVDQALHRGFDPLFGERAHAGRRCLPDAAPGEYLALSHLLARHDATRPLFEPRAWMGAGDRP